MSDALPRPAGEPVPPPPPPSAMPPPPGAMPIMATPGQPPRDITGVYYSTGLTILLMIVTLGIWGIFWTFHTNEDLKRYNRTGLGGGLGILIYIVLSVVLMFTIPNEIEGMYQRDGRKSPVGMLLGLWFLLPIVGLFIWYIKVQRALNEFWASKATSVVAA
jgi:hypothetical protein